MTAADLDLAAILARAEAAYDFARKDPCAKDGFLPLSTREHFNYDVPALIGAVKRLTAELEEALQRPAVTVPAARLERLRTNDGCYRVLREGVGAGSPTYDPFVEVLDASWLPVRDPRVGPSAAGIAAGILDQHGEAALWSHLESLVQQLSDQEGTGTRG